MNQMFLKPKNFNFNNQDPQPVLNKDIFSVALKILTYSVFPTNEFSRLNNDAKLTIIIFLIKRNLILKNENREICNEELTRELLINKIDFNCKKNQCSLMDTILNKIFRKCFNYYMNELDQEKFHEFILKKKDAQSVANKTFWYIFFNDCMGSNLGENHQKDFKIFFKNFCSNKHVDRKKRKKISKTGKITPKYLSLVLRFFTIKKWFSFVKKNRVFKYYFHQLRELIIEDFFKRHDVYGIMYEQKKNQNKSPFESINLNGCLSNCLEKIIQYQNSEEFVMNPKKIRKDLKNLKSPYTLNDYLFVFSFK